jgi:hypothetical protein
LDIVDNGLIESDKALAVKTSSSVSILNTADIDMLFSEDL